MRPTLFLSDLHLSPDRPREAAAFRAFCEGPAREAAAVYILGDLFDWWIGDDQLRDAFASRVAADIAGVTRAGVPVFVARGNRDFLLGERFARATGATLLPEQSVVDAGGVPTLVAHGDELCVADADYQRYRSRMRAPETQRRLLGLPYAVRRAIAWWLRRRSRDATAMKPEAILDVTPGAVDDAFRTHRVGRMVHGHTHRPARHATVVDGVARERYVLADWHDRGHYLAIGDDGAVSHTIEASPGA